MASVDPNVLSRIFGDAPIAQQGAFDPGTTHGQRMISMLAGTGSGMTQAANQPGANFAQALGGGARGMMAGRAQALQQQQMQQALQAQQREQQRQKRIQEAIYGKPGDFASQVDTGPVRGAQQPQSGQGVRIAPAAPQPQITSQPMPTQDVPVGALGGMFESNGDPAAVNTGEGDPGGASYGTHQLSSRKGTLQAFFQSPEGQPFAMQFGDLEPGSEQFNQIWKEVAQNESAGPAFQQAQQKFMERTHFGPALERAQKTGLNVSNPGIREAVVSMGTQHSPAGNLQIINDAKARLPQDASSGQVIDALYQSRTSYVNSLPEEGENALSPRMKENISRRYRRERMAAKQLAGGGGQEVPQQAQTVLGGQGPQAAPQQPQAPTQAAPAPQAPTQNGYQQRGGAQQGLAAGLPPQAQQVLSLLPPDKQAEYLAKQQFAGPGDTPARIQEAQVIAQQTGQPVGQVLAEMRGLGEGESPSSTEAKITRLMDADPSLDYPTAVALADGRYVVSRDPISGEAQILDKATGQQVGTTTQEGVNEYENPPRQTLIPDDLDLTKATGAGGALRKIWNRVRGATGASLSEEGEEAEQAIQALGNLSMQTEVALAQEVAGRPSNYLLERLRQVTVEPASVLQGSSIAKERLRATTSLIDQKLDIVSDVVNNPNEYRPAEVSQARRNKTQLEFLKEQYDTAYRIFDEGPVDSGSISFSEEEQGLIDRWAE